MATETADMIVIVGAGVALGGFAVSLFNSWKAVQWKRSELANSYLKDLFNKEDLVFACRMLEWDGVRLVVPERWSPLLPGEEQTIQHDRAVMRSSVSSVPSVEDIRNDPRLQIYRMAFDSLLSWMGLVDQALGRKLFAPDDIEEAAHWVRRLAGAEWLSPFSKSYHYDEILERLVEAFNVTPAPIRLDSQPES